MKREEQMKRVWLILWFIVSAAGCARSAGTSSDMVTRVAPSDIHKGAVSLSNRLGEEVTLEGLAENAKQGAMLVGDAFGVYIDKLKEWPDEILGKPVKVTGTLVHRKITPYPTASRDGSARAGISGEVYIIENARWVTN